MGEGVSEVVVATRNSKKVAEIGRILDGTAVGLRDLGEFPGCPEVEETEDSFEGNALKKAREVAAFTGLPALADDSGLVVDALDGAPGVFSARYAGEDADDMDNNRKLLKELEGVPEERRTARFVCVIALSVPGGGEHVFEGRVEGRIGHESRGATGFGYDPLFVPEGHERTFAEMSGEEKDSMSHRGRALRKLREHFDQGGATGPS